MRCYFYVIRQIACESFLRQQTIYEPLLLSLLDSSVTFFLIFNAVKNLHNVTNTNTLQDDDAGSMEMHCSPATITYKILTYIHTKNRPKK